VRVYLDSSALVKLVHTEDETPALRSYLRLHRSDRQITSTLARTELARAASLRGPATLTAARQLLRLTQQIDLDRPLLDAVGVLETVPPLRTLDAIHLASARTVPELRSIVTYDRRMAAAAESLGLAVESPA
jgi:predicted nucleic acid-binding protein